jgi:hypothetical protein
MSKILKISIHRCKDCPYISFGPQGLSFLCRLDNSSRIINGQDLHLIPDWCPLEEEFNEEGGSSGEGNLLAQKGGI